MAACKGRFDMFKTCYLCGETKPVGLFKKNSKCSFGVEGRCKACASKQSNLRYKPPTEEQRQRRRNYIRDNAEHIYRRWQAWYTKNADKRREYHKQYHIDHPEVARENDYKRRAYARQTGTNYTWAEWKALCDRYGNVCLKCREVKPLEVDHIVPLSKGGLNSIDNIQPLCRRCNSGKRDKTIDYR